MKRAGRIEAFSRVFWKTFVATICTFSASVVIGLPASAEVLWSHPVGDLTLALQRGQKSEFRFVISSDKPFQRSVSFVSDKQRLLVGFQERELQDKNSIRIPKNPLVQALSVHDGKLQIALTDLAWDKRRVQETSSALLVSADIPSENFVVNVFATKGKAAPVLQVWDAKVKERKVIPVPLIPLTPEEEKQAIAEENAAAAEENNEFEVEVVGEEVTAIGGQGTDESEESLKIAALTEEGEESNKLVAKSEGETTPEVSESSAEEEVRASFSTSGLSAKADVKIRPFEQVVVVGESMKLTLANDGLGKGQVVFQVYEERLGQVGKTSTNFLNVNPSLVDLSPGDQQTVALSFIRPSLDGERIFRVYAMDKNAEGKRVGSARIFLQPVDGVARVAWTRDETAITFTNKGNITSKFIDVEICEQACTPVKDIYLYPDGEYVLNISKDASLKLTQVVGGNRRSGTIPKLS